MKMRFLTGLIIIRHRLLKTRDIKNSLKRLWKDSFKDRALFYSTFPIREQSEKGDWSFQLLPIYFIAILDFEYDENTTSNTISKFRRDVCLKDQDGDIFFEKLNFKFLQMPLFNKQEDELVTHFG